MKITILAQKGIESLFKYLIMVLHLIAILNPENIFLWRVIVVFTIFVTTAAFLPINYLSIVQTIAAALIPSRLDYCNSLLFDIASKGILKLQSVQNCLVKFVSRSPRFSHFVPLLKSLHCLPVQSRIIFKLFAPLTIKLSSEEPSYLFSMLSLAPKPWELRSSCFHLLSVPRVKTHAGTRALFTWCPYLKTHLFRLVYPS